MKLESMSYDQFREIRFRADKAIWKDASPFYFESFHRGYVQRDRVDLFVIEPDGVREVPFTTKDFDYGDSDGGPIADTDRGHAGLKIVCDIRDLVDAEEMLTFLGASYFRARSRETDYGTSARALAIDVAMNQDEEFPHFQAFWIQRPTTAETSLTVYGLMESPSVVGAYKFHFHPGTVESELAVESTLYFRQSPNKLAYAPLTSMWMWGDGLEGPPLDARPGVHDSDGLLVRTLDADKSEHWIWRPLSRQDYPSVSRIDVHSLQGFGLMQRNRAYYHFDDHNARYTIYRAIFPGRPQARRLSRARDKPTD